MVTHVTWYHEFLKFSNNVTVSSVFKSGISILLLLFIIFKNYQLKNHYFDNPWNWTRWVQKSNFSQEQSGILQPWELKRSSSKPCTDWSLFVSSTSNLKYLLFTSFNEKLLQQPVSGLDVFSHITYLRKIHLCAFSWIFFNNRPSLNDLTLHNPTWKIFLQESTLDYF